MNKKELISIYGGKVTDWKRHKNADGSKGGWVHRDAKIHNNIYVGELAVFLGGVFRGGVFHGGDFRGGVFHGGDFRGGVFHGGVFRGGVFLGGVFRGGVFHGGVFHGGVFHGGVFRGGVFHGGVFLGGVFRGGVFHGGVFRGGVFRGGYFYVTPPIATRHDGYVFTAKIVEGEMRIWAGCRNFSLAEALDHWGAGHRFSEESLAIVKFLETQARLPIHNQGVPE